MSPHPVAGPSLSMTRSAPNRTIDNESKIIFPHIMGPLYPPNRERSRTAYPAIRFVYYISPEAERDSWKCVSILASASKVE